MERGSLLKQTLGRIKENALDDTAMHGARARWDSIAKPLHSLGRLEDAVVRIAGIQGTPHVDIRKKALVVFCADNGVAEEGVTQTGQEVTVIVAGNFQNDKTCTALFCRDSGTDVFPVDIGMAADAPGVERRKIAYGTKNMAKEPAMSYEDALDAIETGIAIAGELKQKGYQMLAAGEMGIGNTTTSGAVAAALTGSPPESLAGRGAGLNAEGLQKKIEVIKKALKLHRPNPADPVDALAKVGGFDLAGMAGLYLGAAAERLPVMMDGFISLTAAYAAKRLCPRAADCWLASHMPKEPGGVYMLEQLGMQPFLTCDLCLGEGSGAALAFPLLESAVNVYYKMPSFADIGVEAYQPYE